MDLEFGKTLDASKVCTFNFQLDCRILYFQNVYIPQPFQVIGHLHFLFLGIGRLRLHGRRIYVASN